MKVLVNFFYAQPVGHAVEALHYAHGHHAADPARRISVALNAATPTELADLCPWVEHAYAVDHPFVEAGHAPLTLPREWDWVLDDPRRHQPFQTETFHGMRDYYAASDAHLIASQGRTIARPGRLSYLPHRPLRLSLDPAPLEQRTFAVMLAGSSEPALYPSEDAWRSILDALHEAHPDVRPALIGRTAHDARTRSALDRHAFRDHPSNPLDAYDLPLERQLAIIPDVERFPCFSQFSPAEVIDGRTPSMSDERIRQDLDRIVAAATELLDGRLTYEQSLTDYFTQLRAVTSDIWSIDGVHLGYV